jgi:hypothetical protein
MKTTVTIVLTVIVGIGYFFFMDQRNERLTLEKRIVEIRQNLEEDKYLKTASPVQYDYWTEVLKDYEHELMERFNTSI